MPILSYLKLWLVWILYTPFFVVVLFFQWVMRFFKPKQLRALAQKTLAFFTKNLYFFMGVKVSVDGLENIPQGGAVFIANHQEITDILCVYGYLNRPMAMVAKKELRFVPIIANWMKDMQCYLLDRKDPRQAMALFEKACSNIKNDGYPALIFAEGTRSKGPQNRAFHMGSMRLPVMAGCPIVPITINGSWKIFHKKPLTVYPARVKLVVHKPIDASAYGKARQKELAEAVQKAVESGFTAENNP